MKNYTQVEVVWESFRRPISRRLSILPDLLHTPKHPFMELAKTYKIETERLIIRCYHPKDAVLLKRSIDESIDHLLPWMPWARNEPESLENKIERLRKYRGQFDLGEDYVFGIFNKKEDKLIGSTGLHTRAGENAREIGYWINAHEIGKGYALEAASALTKVGFEIEGLDRIEIHCAPDNIRSQNIPRKLGFLQEAILRNRTVDSSGMKRDVMIWTLFREEYLERAAHFQSVRAFNLIEEEIIG